MTSELYTEGETGTYYYRLFFQVLSGSALTEAESQSLIRHTAERVWRAG